MGGLLVAHPSAGPRCPEAPCHLAGGLAEVLPALSVHASPCQPQCRGRSPGPWPLASQQRGGHSFAPAAVQRPPACCSVPLSKALPSGEAALPGPARSAGHRGLLWVEALARTLTHPVGGLREPQLAGGLEGVHWKKSRVVREGRRGQGRGDARQGRASKDQDVQGAAAGCSE